MSYSGNNLKPAAIEGKPLLNDCDESYQQQQNGEPYVEGIPLYDGENVPSGVSRFVITGYRDVWAAVAFVLAVVASCGLAAYNYKDLRGNEDHSDNNTLRAIRDWVPVAALVSVILGGCVISAMRVFARQFIIGANVFIILLDFGAAGFLFVKHVMWPAVLLILCGCLQALWLYLARRRIPFATALLSTSARLIFRFKGTMVASFVGLLAAAAYVAIWILMAIPVNRNLSQDEQRSPTWTFPAALGLLLMLLWATQVCANVVHVTASGVVATWYFAGESFVPPNPTLASAKRAMTTSFGSICFGSLVVAVVKLIYYMVRAAANQTRNSFALCILQCVVGIIERLFEWFNVYAFTHVAIYGTSYIESAKLTWQMIKSCGWSAYFNDCLVWPVLSLTCFFTSAIVGVAFGLIAWDILVGVIAFITCYIIIILMLRPVYSGIVTQFVCIAEAEGVMQQANPQYFAEIEAATQALMGPVC